MGPFNIVGIDRVKLVQALYRHARPGAPGELTAAEVESALAAAKNDDVFDFTTIKGRTIGVTINERLLYRPQLFESGPEECLRAVEEARG